MIAVSIGSSAQMLTTLKTIYWGILNADKALAFLYKIGLFIFKRLSLIACIPITGYGSQVPRCRHCQCEPPSQGFTVTWRSTPKMCH